MKKIIQFFIIASTIFISLLYGSEVEAQNIGINGTGAFAHPSALLDIDASPSNNTGLLIPRIPLTAINASAPITTPTISLLVYNTASASSGTNAVSPGYYYWDGTKWIRFAFNQSGNSANDWSTIGNTGTTAGTNFLGTTDSQDLVFKTNNTEKLRVLSNGNVGIGTSSPINYLHLNYNNSTIFTTTNNATYIGTQVPNTNSSNGTTAGLYLRSNTYDGGIFAITDGTANGGRLAFVGDNPSSETMSIWQDKVGIGTTTPSNALHIIGGVRPLKIERSGVDNWEFSIDANRLHAFNASTGNFVLSINKNGFVGINNTAPSEALDIQGSVKIVDGTQGNGKVLVSDAAGKGSWQNNVSITPTILGNIPPTVISLSSSDIYTGSSISLPAGKWLVFLGIQVNGAPIPSAGQSAWVRYTLSSSSSSNTNAGFSFMQSSVVSTNVGSAGYVFFPCTGVLPVNLSAATTLYIWTSSCQSQGGYSLSNLNIGPNPENYVFAVPIN